MESRRQYILLENRFPSPRLDLWLVPVKLSSASLIMSPTLPHPPSLNGTLSFPPIDQLGWLRPGILWVPISGGRVGVLGTPGTVCDRAAITVVP